MRMATIWMINSAGNGCATVVIVVKNAPFAWMVPWMVASWPTVNVATTRRRSRLFEEQSQNFPMKSAAICPPHDRH